MSTFFSPKSVAVIGASRDEGSVGHALLKNILVGGFQGDVFPVNPKAAELEGLRSYADVSLVPGHPDLAVIVIKASLVPCVLEECGKKGIKNAVVISAGFREVGSQGKILEDEVKKIARQYQISLIGPNCLGFLNTDPKVKLNATFAKEMPAAGSIAFLSQSGALCTAVLEYAKSERVGFSKIVSMGNKAGLNEIDLLTALQDDPQTKVILVYLEDLVEGHRFIEVAREITGREQGGKPILAVKSGRTPEGAKAVSSHTGSLAGSDEVYDAIFAQAGVLRVDSVEELFDYARAFSSQPLPAGRRVAIVTNAGGPGIMAADTCIRYGLTLPKLQPVTVEALRPVLPVTASLNNPVDLIGDAQEDRYSAAVQTVLKDKNVDGLIVMATPQAMTHLEKIGEVIRQAAHQTTKPVLACFVGVTDVSLSHYRFPESAVRTLAKMNEYREWIERRRTTVKTFQVDRAAAEAEIEKARREGRNSLDQFEALKVFEAYGLPVPPFAVAATAADACRAAQKMGFPVVLKILSPDVLHKVDVGGVQLNLKSEDEARQAFEKMLRTVAQKMPAARIQGALVQKMVPPGTEMILGMKRDPQFGPLLMFGLGGIYVEVFKDVAFRLAPVRELGAEHMIQSIRAFRILQGYRGQPPADVPKLIECIERVSQMACELEEIEELDMNPLMVYSQGEGAMAADARILLTKERA